MKRDLNIRWPFASMASANPIAIPISTGGTRVVAEGGPVAEKTWTKAATTHTRYELPRQAEPTWTPSEQEFPDDGFVDIRQGSIIRQSRKVSGE